MKFAAYDNDGKITGFYDREIHTNIPEQSIEISDLQWQTILADVSAYRVDTETQEVVTAPVDLAAQLIHARNLKLGEIKTAYNASKIKFTSSALGSEHNYLTDSMFLELLNGLILEGSSAVYYYISETGAFVAVNHTLSQLQTVMADFMSHLQSILDNYITKTSAIASATTIEDVNAITW